MISIFRFSGKPYSSYHIPLRRNFTTTNTTSPSPRKSYEPIPVRSLRRETNREKWIKTLNRLNQPTGHLSLAGGYVHQVLYEFMQKDADALGIKYIFSNIYSFENHVLVPVLRERLRERGLSMEGDYVELRTRLAENSDIFEEKKETGQVKNKKETEQVRKKKEKIVK